MRLQIHANNVAQQLFSQLLIRYFIKRNLCLKNRKILTMHQWIQKNHFDPLVEVPFPPSFHLGGILEIHSRKVYRVPIHTAQMNRWDTGNWRCQSTGFSVDGAFEGRNRLHGRTILHLGYTRNYVTEQMEFCLIRN